MYKESFGSSFDTFIGNAICSCFSSDLSPENFKQLNTKIKELLFDNKSSKFCDNYEEIKCFFMLNEAVTSIDYLNETGQVYKYDNIS